MSYIRAKKINGWFLENGYRNLERAFAKHRARLSTPSKDGFLRCLTLQSGEEILFTANALPLNSSAAQSLAHDKLATYQSLARSRVKVPKGFAFFASQFRNRPTKIEPQLLVENLTNSVRDQFSLLMDNQFRLVVKPGRESQSFLVKVCKTIAQLQQHAEKILDVGAYGLVQEYVEAPEYRVVLLEDEILFIYLKPIREIDGRSKARREKSQSKLPLLIPVDGVSKEIRETAMKAHRTLGLTYSGVDVCLPNGQPPAVVLEVNSNPGLDFIEKLHPRLSALVCEKIVLAILKRCSPR